MLSQKGQCEVHATVLGCLEAVWVCLALTVSTALFAGPGLHVKDGFIHIKTPVNRDSG